MANKPAHYKSKLLQALEQTMGIVTDACNISGVSRSSYYDYYRSDEVFRKQVEELSNVALDFAESKLFQKMKGVEVQKKNNKGEEIIYSIPPSDSALIFYLKTKGKGRGYIERYESENINYNLNHTLVFDSTGKSPHVEDSPVP